MDASVRLPAPGGGAVPTDFRGGTNGAGLRRSDRRAAGIILAALAGGLVPLEPVGSMVLDRLWLGAFAAVVAYVASHARRLPLYVATAMVSVVASGVPALGLAAAAVGLAVVSGRHLGRSAVFTRGGAGGLAVASLLWTYDNAPVPAALLIVTALIAYSGFRYMPPPSRTLLLRSLFGVALFAAVAMAAAGVGMVLSQRAVASAAQDFERGIASARSGDIAAARTFLERSTTDIDRVRTDLGRIAFAARVLPGAAENVDAVLGALDDVAVVTDRGSRTASALDLDSLTLDQGRIDVDALATLQNPLRRLDDALTAVVDGIDARLDGPLLPPIREQLGELRDVAVDGQQETALAVQAAESLPGALGADGQRRYLVLFTSPAEARGRFGFPGSYAEIVVDDGRLDMVDHGSVSQTFQDVPPLDPDAVDLGDDRVRPYLQYGVTRLLLNATIPPDFPTVAQLAAERWLAAGRQPVDGVMRFDPAALAALIGLTGPVTVEDVDSPLTADNLEEFLVRGQYVQFPDEQAPRRELLETVSEVVFDRLVTGSLPSPRILGEVFAPLVSEGHLNASAFDGAPAAFLDRIGVSGTLPEPTGDALLVTSVNSTGNKIDSFLRRTVQYTATDSGGQRTADLVVELFNDAPGSDLPFYVIGSFLDPAPPLGTNRTTLLLYTAMPVEEVRVAGIPVDVLLSRSGGWWLAHVPVEIAPRSSVRIEARLAGDDIAPGTTLRIEPGGGTEVDQYEVELWRGGETTASFSGPVVTPTIVEPDRP